MHLAAHAQAVGLLNLLALAAGCGDRPSPRRLALERARCSRPQGKYALVSTLESTQGSCSQAKKVSHDSLVFDNSGKYVPPVPGLISCSTDQTGCFLYVDCTSPELFGADATLDAEVSADGASISGTGTITGEYRGCQKVVYTLEATRPTPPS